MHPAAKRLQMARFRQPYLYGIDRERDVRAILREMVRGKWGCSLPDAPSGQGLYHAPGDAPIDEVDGRPPLSLSLSVELLAKGTSKVEGVKS